MRMLLTYAGSGHVYQLEELVALVPRKATAGGNMAPAWPGVCRLPASHQRAIDEAGHLSSTFEDFCAASLALHIVAMLASSLLRPFRWHCSLKADTDTQQLTQPNLRVWSMC